MRHRRPARAALAAVTSAVALAAALVLPGGSATAATASVSGVTLNGYEAAMLSAINGARTSHGLRKLTVVAGATDVARRWAWHLAGAEQLTHNPAIISDLEHAGSSAWGDIAENIGMAAATSPATLMSAYLHSAPHRANILDPSVRYLGVGVVQRGDTAWNTLDFVDAYDSHYGRTRVPPAGMTLDTTVVRSTATLASLEAPDERVGTARSGGVTASLPHFSGPTSGNDYASAALTRTGSGFGEVFLRDAVDLQQARSLRLQLSARSANGKAVAVQVVLSRAYGASTTVGTVTVGSGATWFTVAVPASARGWRDTLALRVTSSTLGAAGGKATLAVYAVTAAV